MGHRGQLRVSEGVQLLMALQEEDEKDTPHLGLRYPSAAQPMPAEYETHTAIALFLVIDPDDEDAAVTTVRTDDGGVRFLAAKNRPPSDADMLAAERLSLAIRDPERTVKALREVVMRNCHLRMAECWLRMDDHDLTREEFVAAVYAYRRSENRMSGRPVTEPTAFWDEQDGAMKLYQESTNQPDVFSSLILLWDSIQRFKPTMKIPPLLPTVQGELEHLCYRWHKFSAAVSWLVISDFFERMTNFQEAQAAIDFPDKLLEKLEAVRSLWLQVARYDMSIASIDGYFTRHPQIASQFAIEWIEPSRSTETILLSESAVPAAWSFAAKAGLPVVDQEEFDYLFSRALWDPAPRLTVHPELKLLRHMLLHENLDGQLAQKHHQAIGCSGETCWTCQLYHNYVKLMLPQWPFWIQAATPSFVGLADVTWKFPSLPTGMGIDRRFIGGMMEDIMNSCRDHLEPFEPEI